jgi:putative NADH-flavin reductase
MTESHRILVLGGSGPTGRLIVAQALAKGHTVTALARTPDRAGLRHPQLTLVAADAVNDPEALSLAVSGHDAVVSALGVGKALRSNHLMTRATPLIIDSMKRSDVRRLVYISAIGVGGSAPTAPLPFRLAWRLLLDDVYTDKAKAESFVRASPLDWTILAPVMLKDGPPAGRVRFTDGSPHTGPWRIARADVADAVFRCLADSTTIGKRLVVQ